MITHFGFFYQVNLLSYPISVLWPSFCNVFQDLSSVIPDLNEHVQEVEEILQGFHKFCFLYKSD